MLASKVVATGRCSLGVVMLSSRRHTWFSYALALPTLQPASAIQFFTGALRSWALPSTRSLRELQSHSTRLSWGTPTRIVIQHPRGFKSLPPYYWCSKLFFGDKINYSYSRVIRHFIAVLIRKEGSILYFCSKGVLFLLSGRRLFLREEDTIFFSRFPKSVY